MYLMLLLQQRALQTAAASFRCGCYFTEPM